VVRAVIRSADELKCLYSAGRNISSINIQTKNRPDNIENPQKNNINAAVLHAKLLSDNACVCSIHKLFHVKMMIVIRTLLSASGLFVEQVASEAVSNIRTVASLNKEEKFVVEYIRLLEPSYR
jgi:hypothetical protein